MKVQKSDDREKEKRKKKKQSILEAEVMRIMEKSRKTAVDEALDDILKDWKEERAEARSGEQSPQTRGAPERTSAFFRCGPSDGFLFYWNDDSRENRLLKQKCHFVGV